MVTAVFDETGAKMIRATTRICYIQTLKPSQLDVVTSVFDEAGAKMTSATRHIFYTQNLKRASVNHARLPVGKNMWAKARGRREGQGFFVVATYVRAKRLRLSTSNTSERNC